MFFSGFVRQCFVAVRRESVSDLGTDRVGEVTEQQGAVDMSLLSNTGESSCSITAQTSSLV